MTDWRQRGNRARFVQGLVSERCKDADRVVLVINQLNVHSPASLCGAFPPVEAKRIAPVGQPVGMPV